MSPSKNIRELVGHEIVPGFCAKFVHGERMTVAYWDIKAGSILPEHNHEHEQIVNMIEGEFELVVAGEPVHMKPGDVLVLPSDVKHGGKAITDCRIIDVFQPVRDDYFFE